VGFQRELGSNLALEVNYVGNAGIHYGGQIGTYNLNPAALGTGPFPERTRYFSTVPSAAYIWFWDWRDRAHYHALQTTLTKRFSGGLSMMASYTWSHDLGTFPAQDQLDQTFANTEIDARNRFTANWLYELPVGRGKRFGRDLHPVLDGLAGGWRFRGVLQFQSGSLIR
jgi:hypothetical protein